MNSETVGKLVQYSERYLPLMIWGLLAAATTTLLLAIMGVEGIQLKTAFYHEILWTAFFPSIYMLIAFLRYRYVIVATTLAILPAALSGLGF